MPTEPRNFDDVKRHAVYLRDGYRCAYSGYVDKTCTGKRLSLDHIASLHGEGGELQNKRGEPATNLITAHGPTNFAKRDRTKEEWSAYAKNIAPPRSGLQFNWKDVEDQAKPPPELDLKRGAELSKLAKQARAARRLDSRGKRTIETPASKEIAAKSAAIVASYQAEQKAAADKKKGPGVRHDKDGRFMPGNESRRYALRAGEYLAISADAIRRDADGLFLMTGGEPPANEAHGSVGIVNVRGALQQFCSPFGDSYEAIEQRVRDAQCADPKPTTIMLRISSPGGLVAGLNECVFRLQRMAKDSGIPLVAYVYELAASAGYALCCACSKVLGPPSAIVGSVGVISTMISVAAHDADQGIDYRIITSGKRKADGHLHTPISEDAVRSEAGRNAQLAAQFFAIASKARGVPAAKLESLQAAIYLGKDAVRVGLMDEVIGLDDALMGLDRSEIGGPAKAAPNTGNATDRRAREPRSDVARLLRGPRA